MRSSLALVAVITLSVTAACNDKPAATPSVQVPPTAPVAAPTTPVAAASPAPVGPTGSIHGKVAFTGAKAPDMDELKRGADPVCAKDKMKDELVVVNPNHTVKNVLVYVVGAPPAAAAPTAPVELVQTACMYRPRVQGLVAGQTLNIKNGDPTLHNVHTYRGTSTVFNVAQVPGTPDIQKVFKDNGALLKFKCDVHQWMTGYVWIQNNGLFAVTGDDGSFDLKNVPVGTWPVVAWQEYYGEKKGTVTVAEGKPAELKFEYSGAEAGLH